MGKLIVGVNDLLTWCSENKAWGQRIKEEWTGIREDGKHFEMNEVAYGSTKYKFKFRCRDCGYEWWTMIY